MRHFSEPLYSVCIQEEDALNPNSAASAETSIKLSLKYVILCKCFTVSRSRSDSQHINYAYKSAIGLYFNQLFCYLHVIGFCRDTVTPPSPVFFTATQDDGDLLKEIQTCKMFFSPFGRMIIAAARPLSSADTEQCRGCMRLSRL